MNFGEGIRRVGVALGVLGAVAGAFLAWPDEARVWNDRSSSQAVATRFESAMNLPAVRRIARAVANKQDPKILFPQIDSRMFFDPKEVDENNLIRDDEMVFVGMDGINHVTLENGVITSIMPTTRGINSKD